jgi:hypothetical protein
MSETELLRLSHGAWEGVCHTDVGGAGIDAVLYKLLHGTGEVDDHLPGAYAMNRCTINRFNLWCICF